MTFFSWSRLLILAYFSHVLSALDCERVLLKDVALIIPTTYCYAGDFSDGGINYASTSSLYECVDGEPFNVAYTNGECKGEGVRTSVKNDPNVDYWCGKTQCDVVHITLYDAVSNADCVDAMHNASLLDSKARFSAAFLLDWCNYMSEELALKLSCDDNVAKLSSYAYPGIEDDHATCKTLIDTTTFNTELAVNCNKTSQALGTLSAISATCEMPETEAKKKKATLIIIIVAVVVVLVLIGIAVYCYLQKKKKEDDDKYSNLMGGDEEEQGVKAEN